VQIHKAENILIIEVVHGELKGGCKNGTNPRRAPRVGVMPEKLRFSTFTWSERLGVLAPTPYSSSLPILIDAPLLTRFFTSSLLLFHTFLIPIVS
jgi:hypothetical protein